MEKRSNSELPEREAVTDPGPLPQGASATELVSSLEPSQPLLVTLLPQFSLRTLFLIVTAACVLGFIVSRSRSGVAWGAALTVFGITSLGIFITQATLFLVLWLFSGTDGYWQKRERKELAEAAARLGATSALADAVKAGQLP